MCILKIFCYEETKLVVIKYKDEIWVRAKTVANILRYQNTMKSIRDHVDPEDKKKLSEFAPKFKQNETSSPEKSPMKGTRKTQFISASPDYTV